MDYTTINPAVAKVILMKMDQKTFIKHAKEIKQLLISNEVTLETMNLRYMYLNLYRWFRSWYLQNF